MLKFDILKQDKSSPRARRGILHLEMGDVQTPVFMPVGTLGCMKGLTHDEIREIGYNLILANTYHLFLQPGEEVLEHYGGIHNFSSWDRNILTDSGGFQVFSLSNLRKIKEEGVRFHSHIDGSIHIFTPESVVQTQGIIGSNIAMCLDVCSAPGIDYKTTKRNTEITHIWAKRAFDEFERRKSNGLKVPCNLFGIIQGGFFEDLRRESVDFITSLAFNGIAIGGLSVGESNEDFIKYLQITTNYLEKEKRPIYVMGIGTPLYILEAIENGVDMFDCVQATRVARHGLLYTKDGLLNITKAKYRLDDSPIEQDCNCRTCRQYSKGYLNHLFRAKESLAGTLASIHNLSFFYDMLVEARKAIDEDRFFSFKRNFLGRFDENKHS